jgi:hypothetical protein
MQKNVNLCVDLKTVMQNDALPVEGQCYNGVLSRDGVDHFIFEESCQKRRCQRNPKLFDGNYVSMVRKQNGKYQFYMKTLADNFNRDNLAYSIYAEVSAAVQILG